jgi:hypothetical protein
LTPSLDGRQEHNTRIEVLPLGNTIFWVGGVARRLHKNWNGDPTQVVIAPAVVICDLARQAGVRNF